MRRYRSAGIGVVDPAIGHIRDQLAALYRIHLFVGKRKPGDSRLLQLKRFPVVVVCSFLFHDLVCLVVLKIKIQAQRAKNIW